MIRFLIALPILVLLVLFALSNPQPIRLGLWPTDYSVFVPLSLAVLLGGGLFFLLGALIAWAGTVPLRMRARRAESLARTLETQLTALRASTAEQHRFSSPALPPPT